MQLKKIVIIGPESTGKSTLCKQLAGHYNTLWCPEYARGYLLKYGTAYTYEGLLTIAKGQLQLEENYIHSITNDESITEDTITANYKLQTTNTPLLFIDTDMYVMKVWCEYVFGKCHQLILDTIAVRQYNLYLLCDVDLPWVKDELREYPDEQPRRELYNIYKDLLINQQTPWVNISGNYQERLQKAINAVEGFCIKAA